MQSCKTCGGSGVLQLQGSNVVKCPACDGTGVQSTPGQFFIYEMGPIVLAGNGIARAQQVQVLDHSFKWMFAIAFSTGVFTSKVYDSRNKRPFTNQEVHSSNLFGTAQNPFPLLSPYTFAKRGAIMADFTDLSGAGNTIRLAFAGVELDD